MKGLKMIYWISTVVFAGIFMSNGVRYLLHAPFFAKRTLDLHYPLYLLDIIGTAKILGGIALVTPKFPRLKEWAYAGFAFDLIGAAWSHFYVQGVREGAVLAVPLAILSMSYFSFLRLQRSPQTAIVKHIKSHAAQPVRL